MTATPVPGTTAPSATGSRADAVTYHEPKGGWLIVATKEFTDHLLSVRFVVLLVLMALAAAVPLYFLADNIRSAPQAAGSNIPALFLGLFWVAPSVNADLSLPSVVGFIGLVGPLLGLAFAFDAINGERARGTLPRLLSQPIHRDDVINGKFVAGLVVISMVVVIMVAAVLAYALIRMGIVPDPMEILRVLIWLVVTFLYIALWLAFGLLLSVVVRGAATSALIGFGVWLIVTFFGGLITSLISGALSPAATTTAQQLSNAGLKQFIERLLPDTLYREASIVLLRPQTFSFEISTPATLAGYEQAQQQIPSISGLSLGQSLVLVWPQMVVLLGLTVACFAAAYVLFMRQEVRA
jgi:ABC-2 type transport system permease protein